MPLFCWRSSLVFSYLQEGHQGNVLRFFVENGIVKVSVMLVGKAGKTASRGTGVLADGVSRNLERCVRRCRSLVKTPFFRPLEIITTKLCSDGEYPGIICALADRISCLTGAD